LSEYSCFESLYAPTLSRPSVDTSNYKVTLAIREIGYDLVVLVVDDYV